MNVLFLIISFLAVSSYCLCAQGHLGSTPFEKFIASPPVIKDVLFSIERTNLSPRFYQAKWQTNAFFFRELPALQDANSQRLSPMANFTSKFNDHIWQFDEAGGLTTYLDGEGMLVNITSRVDSISPILNGGLNNLAIGTIRWSNSCFVSTSYVSGVVMSGNLEYSPSGRPIQMNVRLETSRGTNQHRIRYRTTKDLGSPLLPDVFEYYARVRGNWILVRTYVIHRLATQERPLPEAAYDLSPFGDANNVTRRFFSTNSWAYLDSDGSMQTIQRTVPDQTKKTYVPPAPSRSWP